MKFDIEGLAFIPFYDRYGKLSGCFDEDKTEYVKCVDCPHYQKCPPWLSGGVEHRQEAKRE